MARGYVVAVFSGSAVAHVLASLIEVLSASLASLDDSSSLEYSLLIIDPCANSVIADISATILRMRISLVFVSIASIYCKYAFYIINSLSCASGEFNFLHWARRQGACLSM